MKTIKVGGNAERISFDADVIEQGIETIGAALEGLDIDARNVILVAALTANCEAKAKQSPEYQEVMDAAGGDKGEEPVWGGGNIGMQCGLYQVDITFTLDKVEIMRSMVAEATELGDDPLKVLMRVLGRPKDDCDCPNCKRARGEFEAKH